MPRSPRLTARGTAPAAGLAAPVKNYRHQLEAALHPDVEAIRAKKAIADGARASRQEPGGKGPRAAVPRSPEFAWYFETELGKIFNGDSYHLIASLKDASVDLIVTSPPFGLVRKKEYGNVQADEYLNWFRPFARQFHRVLKDTGSLVIDIGGAWNEGTPTRHLYHFKLLIMLCEEYGFSLAQDFYWWNPAKLPTPAEWVTIRRIRAKDAINKVWWVSKTAWPKASNRRVLTPYSLSMRDLLKNGYTAKRRPSGHDISSQFQTDNGAAIPPNLLAIANTDSNSPYMRYCRDNDLKTHPARFPVELPEFFVRMLTDEGDLIIDPFAGSCVTGEICERLRRRWLCIELREDYLKGALGRFAPNNGHAKRNGNSANGHDASPERAETDESNWFYKLPRPGALWTDRTPDPLDKLGGKKPPKVAPAKPPKRAPAKRPKHDGPSKAVS